MLSYMYFTVYIYFSKHPQEWDNEFSPVDIKELIYSFICLVFVNVKAVKPNVNNKHFIPKH